MAQQHLGFIYLPETALLQLTPPAHLLNSIILTSLNRFFSPLSGSIIVVHMSYYFYFDDASFCHSENRFRLMELFDEGEDFKSRRLNLIL